MKELQQMSDKEKEAFFSADLAERMIRLEQNVSASFNRLIPYDKTEYYKSMSDHQRIQFEKFLKAKKRRLALLSIGLPLFLTSFLMMNFTGRAIAQNVIAEDSFDILSIVIGVVFLFFLAGMIYHFIQKKQKNIRFDKHFSFLRYKFKKDR